MKHVEIVESIGKHCGKQYGKHCGKHCGIVVKDEYIEVFVMYIILVLTGVCQVRSGLPVPPGTDLMKNLATVLVSCYWEFNLVDVQKLDECIQSEGLLVL